MLAMLYKYLKEKELQFNISKAEEFLPEMRLGKGNFTGYIIQFESAFKTAVRENDRVYGELFLPGKNSFQLEKNNGNNKDGLPSISGDIDTLKTIILLHGSSGRFERLQNYYYFIEKAAHNKYAVLFMHLPYHFKRTPDGERSGQHIITNNDTQTLDLFNQSVLDIKKAMEVLKRLFLFQTTYSICGISLGAMVATVAAAWEPLLQKAVLVQCGGNWDEIYWNSAIRLISKGNFINKEKIKREAARQFYSVHPEFLEKYKKINPEEIDAELSCCPELSCYPQKTWFLSDPLTFAHKIDPDRALMINSKYDLVFCRKSTELLHDEMGKPQIYWLNDFHSTRILRQKAVLKIIFDFIEK
jgi:pimeloyl-ACP methyl ester carboxylesterase